MAGARRFLPAAPARLASGDGIVLTLGETVIGVAGFELVDGLITELNLVVDPARLPGPQRAG
jgi:hypothetical protein